MSRRPLPGLQVVVGPVASGKSEELWRRLRVARGAGLAVQVFVPAASPPSPPGIWPWGGGPGVGPGAPGVEVARVVEAAEVWERVRAETAVVAIDGAHLFDGALGDVCDELASEGRQVICAGADLDFRGEPFGSVPRLLALAEDVVKLSGVCAVCGGWASRSQRLVGGAPARYGDPVVVLAGDPAVVYEPRCRWCHQVEGRPARRPATEGAG